MTYKFVPAPTVSFSINLVVMLLLVFLADRFILTADFYESALKTNSIDWNTLIRRRSLGPMAVLYSLSALLLFIKYSLISLLVYTTCYLNGVNATFRSIFKVVCLAEMVFLIPALIKVIWFYFNPPGGLDQWTTFYPLSIHSLLGSSSIPTAAVYPLQVLNVFELMYVLLIAYLLAPSFEGDFDTSLRKVLASYLPALLVWALISAYFIAMINPN